MPIEAAAPVRDTLGPDLDKANKPPLHLDFLDGLRGVCALYVVIFHAYGLFDLADDADGGGFFNGLTKALNLIHIPLFKYGHIGVVIFIVISGYSLMVPVVLSADKRFRGGLWGFFKRRARRILPPYYAALALALVLIFAVPGMNKIVPGWDNDSLPVSPLAVGLHLGLVHNWLPGTAEKINYPMWSVGLEWQFYFVLALVLVPVWRRFGKFWALALAFAGGLVPYFLLGDALEFTSVWFLASFGAGMVAAGVAFSPAPADVKLRDRLKWGWVAGAFFLALAPFLFLDTNFASKISALAWFNDHAGNLDWLKDTLVGLIMACLFVRWSPLTTSVQGGTGPTFIFKRVLESKWVKGLGSFSYSLYLVHVPFLCLFRVALLDWLRLPYTGSFVALMLVGIPLSAGLAYLFSLAFERPFTQARQRKQLETPSGLAFSEN